MATDGLQQDVLAWYAEHQRDLPWRATTDPYAVLVSEIMLQQTQVSRVVPTFERFLTAFPSVTALAAAPAGEVIRAWKGLGYNRRAIALHCAAQAVVERHGGTIPADLDALRALPGVGEYTARAVLAFAFGADAAPVDTNIRRVVTRCITGAPATGRALQAVADAAVPRGKPREWSSALMDLGAAYCTAVPRCDACPVRSACAWASGGGPDPAAVTRPGPAPFKDSPRYHRGRLLDAIRDAGVSRHDLAGAALLDDEQRASRIAESLVRDGLAEWRGDVLHLPG